MNESGKEESSPALPSLSDSPQAHGFLFTAWKAVPLRAKLTLAIAAVVGVALWAWPRTESHPQAASPAPAPIGHWVDQSASSLNGGLDARPSAGKAAGRRLILYHTAQHLSDYRLEFDWKPDSEGVGWVVRDSGAGNYYAIRVALVPYRTPPALAIEHFTVLNGTEGEHSRKLVDAAASEAALRIRMDVAGSAFTTSLQGKPVDYWIDRSLSNGDMGFYEDGNEELPVQFVQLSFPNPHGPGYVGEVQSLVKTSQGLIKDSQAKE